VYYEYPTSCIIIIGLRDCPTHLRVKETAPQSAFEWQAVLWNQKPGEARRSQEHTPSQQRPKTLRIILRIQPKDTRTDRHQCFLEAAEERELRMWVLMALSGCCVTSSKSLHLSEPPFLHTISLGRVQW
jgi:hypothetical protein